MPSIFHPRDPRSHDLFPLAAGAFVVIAVATMLGALVCAVGCPKEARGQESCQESRQEVGPPPDATIGALTPGQVANTPPASMAMELTTEQTGWYRNPDGSCVQCSIGMVGCANNLPAWSTVLWNTPYGRAERGGSWPSRVANYARQRGMRVYNVTGEPTFAWMAWAAKTNRFAAIGAGRAHFQTLYGRSPAAANGQGRWYVCNNNSTGRVDEYTPESFRRLHLASGPWVVIPDEPASAVSPRIVPWWQ